MSIKSLESLFENDKHFAALRDKIAKGKADIEVAASEALRPFLIAQVFKALRKPTFIITDDQERAQRLTKDIKNLLPSSAFFLPDWEILPHERISPGKEIVSERLQVLHYLQAEKPIVVVSSVQTVMRKIPGKESPLLKPIPLKPGGKIGLYHFLEQLTLMGYVRTYKVETRGQFSARGGIVDVFAAGSELPVRVEFFGDEIESLRTFAISTQRSLSQVDLFEIFSCREVYLDAETAKKAVAVLKSRPQTEEIEKDIEKLEKQQYFEGIERYAPFMNEDLATVLDFVPQDSIVVLDDELGVTQEGKRFLAQQKEYLAEAILNGEVVADPASYFLPFEKLRLDTRLLKFSSPQGPEARLELAGNRLSNKKAEYVSNSIEPILGKLERLRKLLRRFLEDRFAVVLAVNDEGQAGRLREILSQWQLDVCLGSTDSPVSARSICLIVGDFNQGFILRDKKFALLSHSDVFLKSYRTGQYETHITKTQAPAYPIKSFADLRRGDYVVHVNHGIAFYAGIVTKEVRSVIRDYLVLNYAQGDKLFVPIDQADRVSKYIGSDPNPPKINRLTGTEWLRAKRRARKSVKELAIDLYSLYAERAKAPGFAFSPDTIWQAELEEAFQFEETTSQLEATTDVKGDMEHARPMDRLVCGDVGYGKTEVAMRAAFKSVMDEKQVMVLVPTTILAEQHYKTFTSRFAPYPIIIEELSRFKSAKDQKKIVERFREGKVDILIGTHRLLQKDVEAKELGLLVIDEEQRFGVAHKEHLKSLKTSIDALTLTATPIPRTLQMSLGGVRDISIMDTPPENRYPVSTYVGELNKEMIRNAVRREIARGGQVYYVHNRVWSIDKIAGLMQKLVPNVRVGVAHGQMSEGALEKIMNQFLARKYDVLLCTTIIESGIDIPTANTLIVDRAERLGLSTLYQLRGRVGRAHHQAYAYFFFSPKRNLTSTAVERLKTIGEFTELGSGLKVAMRDLEIRGAGNLLGPEQHGQMADVGFELYCQMLNQAVQEIKGKSPEKIETRIELPISAYIPNDYIEDEVLRTEAYRRLSSVVSLDEADEVEGELADRYGCLPAPVSSLLDVLRLRVRARNKGITNISWERKRLMFHPIVLSKRELGLLEKKAGGFVYHKKEELLKVDGLRAAEILTFAFKMFDDIIS